MVQSGNNKCIMELVSIVVQLTWAAPFEMWIACHSLACTIQSTDSQKRNERIHAKMEMGENHPEYVADDKNYMYNRKSAAIKTTS